MSAARNNFGRRLREHRERHEITLDEIAATTKIKRSVFASLERGDVANWPSGIFRRAFVREYAAAVGLPPESVVAEFLHLFPDPGTTADAPAAPAPPTSLRLLLAVDRRELMTAAIIRALAALGETAVISGTAALIAWNGAASFWTACGAIALVYYALATAFLGRSPASWYVHGGSRTLRRRQALPTFGASDARDLLYIVKRSEEQRTPVPEETADGASSPALRAASR